MAGGTPPASRMITFIARLILFPLQLLAFGGFMFIGALWLQSETIDGDTMRTGLRAAMAQATGRGVQVGKVDVAFSWPPRITVYNLTVQGAGSSNPLLRVKRVEAELNPWHLLVGGRTVKAARFVEPEILLERDSRGRLNWGGGEAGIARALVRAARVIGAKKVIIAGGRLTVRDRRRGSTTVINLGGIDIEAGSSRAARD